ncbi:FCD domain-containing protein [Streptomyces sp. NPDC050263]|uniref:FadR/GntR family transcriptional regulator n=1 Tax=Streptomyces sp. NPDC050263 TaxID=3155037 RepID=UPI00342154DE
MSTDDSTASAGLRPVDIAPAHSVVVRYLRRAIHLYEFPAGSRLPSERDLATRLGVSRATLREALRNLEGAGYVEVRRGAAGGNFVLDRTGSLDEVRRWFTDQGIDLEAIFDFRATVESLAARRAATRADPALITTLRDLNGRMSRTTDTGEFRQCDQRFHMHIAEAARAELVRNAVEEARAALFHPYRLPALRTLQDRCVPEHEAIIDALANHKDTDAATLMNQHIRATADAADIFTGPDAPEST